MKNEYKITRELMMSWAKKYLLYGARNIIPFVAACIVGLCGLMILGINIFIGGNFLNWYLSILFILYSVFILFFSRFVATARRYKIITRMYGVTEWTRSVEFAEDGIIVRDHTSETRLRYENIRKIREDGNAVLVLFRDNMAVRLYKDAFTEGTWEECEAHLRAKMPRG